MLLLAVQMGLPAARAAGQAGGAPTGGVLPVPVLSGHVIDQTQTLSPEEARALTDKLAAFEKARGTQMVVLIVPSTQPEDIAAYAQRVGDSWKIGRREVGDGLLLVVAKADRTVRIEVAKALEGAVPDLAASQIIERVMVPAFKAGNFATGLDQATQHLMARIQGENLPLPEASEESSGSGSGGNWHVDPLALLALAAMGLQFIFKLIEGAVGRKPAIAAMGLLAGAAVWLISASLIATVIGAVVAMVLAPVIAELPLSGHSGSGRSDSGWGGRGHRGGWDGGGGGGGGWTSGGGGNFGGGGASGKW